MQSQIFNQQRQQLYLDQRPHSLINLGRIQNIEQVGSFVEEIECPICYTVLVKPQNCKKCEKSFCSECYNQWIKISNKVQCPCCRQDVVNQSQSQIPKLLVTLLNKLKINCQNKEQGCNEVISYEQLVKHEQQECQFALISCTNQDCNEKVYRKDFNDHKRKCPFQLVPCPYCKIQFKSGSLRQHANNECAFRKVTCEWCAQAMEYRFLETHGQNCPFKYQTCMICNIKYEVEEYNKHTKEQCLEIQMSQFRDKYEQEKQKNEALTREVEGKNNLIFVLQSQLEEMNYRLSGVINYE